MPELSVQHRLTGFSQKLDGELRAVCGRCGTEQLIDGSFPRRHSLPVRRDGDRQKMGPSLASLTLRSDVPERNDAGASIW